MTNSTDILTEVRVLVDVPAKIPILTNPSEVQILTEMPKVATLSDSREVKSQLRSKQNVPSLTDSTEA